MGHALPQMARPTLCDFPHVCITLGLIDQHVPVIGVIYSPFLKHIYTSVCGAGSFLHMLHSHWYNS
jgi:fructose-1,6-bisphosphatase/inositol monophosphatase family enzyme